MSKEDPEMSAQDVVEMLALLAKNGIEVIVDGGWGVDALLEEQTRHHRDLDVAVLHKDVPALRKLLLARGYREVPQGDSWECNFVLGDDQGHLLDVHSCTFDENGENVFGVKYPLGSWSGQGRIGERVVRCIPPGWMVKFHSGYALDEGDYHDVSRLCSRFGMVVPEEYARFREGGE